MKHLTTPLALGAAALLVVTLAGCGSADAGSAATVEPADDALGSAEIAAQMDELYTQAQEAGETSVVVYGPGEQLYGSAYQVFMARYPDIQVTGEYIFGAELSTRLDQEFSSGQHVGSIQTGGPAITDATNAAGRCEVSDPFAAADLDVPAADDGTYRAVVGYPFGIAYNTDKISEKELPQRFVDIVAPDFTGRFVLEDPTTTNGTTNSLAQMHAAGIIDDAWMQQLADGAPMIRGNGALSVQAVATGEADFEPLAQYVMYKQSIDDGLPIGFFVPSEGSRIEYHYSCILADAPNPKATELLYNWLFTPEGQTALAESGVYGLRPGTPAPGDLPALEDISADPIPSVPVPESGPTTQKFIKVAEKFFQ